LKEKLHHASVKMFKRADRDRLVRVEAFLERLLSQKERGILYPRIPDPKRSAAAKLSHETRRARLQVVQQQADGYVVPSTTDR
jgi:hypothetical protein